MLYACEKGWAQCIKRYEIVRDMSTRIFSPCKGLEIITPPPLIYRRFKKVRNYINKIEVSTVPIPAAFV